MLVIYVMVAMLSTISGHKMMGYLMGALAHPFWFATPENEWSERKCSDERVRNMASMLLKESGKTMVFTGLHWLGFVFAVIGLVLVIL